jgi:cardiolipin synthase A/B
MAMSNRSARSWRALPALLVMLAGCATLPDYDALHRDRSWWRDDPPRIEGVRGPLAPERRAEILRRLAEQGDGTLLQRHLSFMHALRDIPLVAGNEAQLLVDGPATRAAMFRAIEQARQEILLETYIFEDDEFGRALAERLLARRAEGLRVHVIYDSLGSTFTPRSFFDRLRAGGIGVCEFNPINPLRARIFNPNQRDHRKLLVADGAVAFTGGINISSVYARSSLVFWKKPDQPPPVEHGGWRDTHIEIRGPAAVKFRELFADTWRRQHCPGVAARDELPPPQPQGDKLVRVIGTSPDNDRNLIYLELLSAIDHAEKSIYITMAYFVPDPGMIRALAEAARRGVDVKLILADAGNYRLVFHAGRSKYSELLAAGVQIYEWRAAPLHAKTAVIDGVWSNVGSANLDWRSFLHNDEVNAVVLGEGFARDMEALFERDLALATPVTLPEWSRRGYGNRLKEFGARIVEYWL